MMRVSLLGEQVVTDATGAVVCRSPRTLALIGYLAIHAGSPRSRRLIAGLFWPRSTDAQALTNLRRELHQLRSLVGDDALRVTSRDLCWCDTESCEVDVRVLLQAHDGLGRADDDRERSAAAAVAAYGGDFLPSVYDDWAVAARDDLRRRCTELCDVVVDLARRRGDLHCAVAVARRRVALEPLEESGYQVLMRLHVAQGDRAAAIAVYHQCAAVLGRELGVVPGPRTRRTLERLSGRAGGATARRSAGGTDADAPLVGREEALGALLDQWRSTVDQERARVVVVRGTAGVGTSRLVAELVRDVRAGAATVATARCLDGSERLALSAVAGWLRTPDLRAASRELEPVWRAEVERLVPDRRGTGEQRPVGAWAQHRFFEGLARVLLQVRRPLLLVLDDLQWCDAETLAWLSFVLGLARRRPLMVAVTMRDQAPGDRAPGEWLTRLRSGHLVADLTLAPLDRELTATLASAVCGRPLSEQDASLLHAATGGFPRYVVEAARAARDGPGDGVPGDRLAPVLLHRLEQTSTPAQETAALAAALGHRVTLDLLADAGDLDAPTVARAVDELWRSRILRELGDGYAFSSELLRDAAYQRVSPPHRWLLRRRLARARELAAVGRDGTAVGLAPV